MPDSAGLLDRFGTLARIGSGAMGIVFEGFDEQRQSAVAIKMLASVDPDSVRRMQREAAVLARVQHRNVCAILEFGQSDDGPWILMPLVKGLPLDQAWQSLPLDARIDLLIDVCRGVEAAHAAGLIHRDLKPANILVEQDSHGHLTPVVMDFGIARNESDPDSSLTATGDVVGTPDSMSPEQVKGDRNQIDRRTDVWAIGCLLYRALCDRSPHAGNSAADVMAMIVTKDVISPRAHEPTVPRQLSRICMQCLERDLSRRYGDVIAIREDLQRYRNGLPVHARDTGIRFALLRSWRRNRIAWSIALALTFGLLLTLVGLVLSQFEGARREQLARQLGATQEIVRNRMQIAHLAPLHDLRPERKALAALEKEAAMYLDRGSAGIRALAQRSIGLSALALGNHDQVVTMLTPLTGSKFADDTDRRALASAHLHIYANVADRFANLPEAERDAALITARKRHLQPARIILANVHERVGLEQIRLLLVDGQLIKARAMLAGLPAEPASEYAVRELSGDLQMADAAVFAANGDRQSALQAYTGAQATFEQAAMTARSDGRVLRRVCDSAVGALRQRISKASESPLSPAALHPACADALTANPADPITHESLAAAWETIASNHDLRNERAATDAALAAAIQHADLAVSHEPGLLSARLIGARARYQQAGRLADNLTAAQALYDQALALLKPLLDEAPGFAPAILLQGRLLAERARQLNNFGENSEMVPYERALAALREARRLRPQNPETINALGLTLVFKFYALRNKDLVAARAVMNEAIALLDEVLAHTPDDPDMLFSQAANLGDLWGAEAAWATDTAAFVNAGKNLDMAQQLFQRLRKTAPGRVDGYSQSIAQLATFAELARARGLPRDQRLQQARTIVHAAERARVVLDQNLLAWLALETAIAASETNAAETAAAFATADRYLSSAVKDADEYYSATRQRLEWVVAKLDWKLRTAQPMALVIEQGDATVKALLAHPRGSNDSIVQCNAAAFDWLLGSNVISHSGVPVSGRIAAADLAFRRCQKLNPSYARRWQKMATQAAAAK